MLAASEFALSLAAFHGRRAPAPSEMGSGLWRWTEMPERSPALTEALNDFFIRKGIGWQLVDGAIVTRGAEAFEETVKAARRTLEEGGRPTASKHIHEALQDLSRRPAPDLPGAIFHSTGCLECVARDVTGNEKATLGDILKKQNTAQKVRPNNSQSDTAAIFPSLTPKAVKRVLEFFTAQNQQRSHSPRLHECCAPLRRLVCRQRYSGAFPGSAFPRGPPLSRICRTSFRRPQSSSTWPHSGCCSTGDCGRGGDLPQSASTVRIRSLAAT
jgi:hypothetical protein